MKRNMFVAALLALCLVFAAIPALATDYGCFPVIPLSGSADVKYYQDQSAGAAIGVTNSCYSEQGAFHSDKSAVDLQATAFGAVDKVGMSGALGVGQVKLNGSVTNTDTCGAYTIHQTTVALNNQAQMNQLGGIAATSTGMAGSGGNISQTQNLTSAGFAVLPGGVAMTSYCGTQTANLSAGAGR